MKAITSVLLYAACLMLFLSSGCETTQPTRITKPSAANAKTLEHNWVPGVSIVLHSDQAEKSGRETLQGHIRRAARVARIKCLREGTPIPADIDVIVDVAGSDEPSVSISPGAVYSDAAARCKVDCFDSQGRFVATRSFFSSAHISESDVAAGASLILLISTASMWSSVEESILRSNTRNIVMRDLAAQIVNFAADSAQIQRLLLNSTSDMDAADITNLGVDRFDRQKYSEAEFYLTEAVCRFPGYQPAYCYLGACLVHQGKREEGLILLRKAIHMDPYTEEALQAAKWVDALRPE